MVAVFVKLKIESASKIITNSDMTESFQIGDAYRVYGIEVYDGETYYIIFDGHHLLSIPAAMFNIVDNNVPNTWKVQYNVDGLKLYPELFYSEYFFDRFSDYDPYLRELFVSNIDI